MHCPKCGLQIESEELSFCSRCGQTLGLIRAALTAEQGRTAPSLPPRSSKVNLGVTFMFLGSIPAIATILTMPWAAPIAIALLIGAYFTVLLGSGPLLRSLSTNESSLSDLLQKEIRKEMAFGATLMLVALFLSVCMVALVPGQWEKVFFLVFPFIAFLIALLTSGWIKNSIWGMLGVESGRSVSGVLTAKPTAVESLETGDLEPMQIASGSDFSPTSDSHPPSVTEGTTRLLKDER
jgi:predicted nucleic acid-binding Zn ribbon protein